MTRHTDREYYPGDHLVICDRCGFKYYRSQTRKEWQGWLTCIGSGTKGCWEPRHPQDITPPYRLDRQWVEDNRPQPIDDFDTLSDELWTVQDWTTYSETDPNSRLTVASGQVDLVLNQNADARIFRYFGDDFFKDRFGFRITLSGSHTGGSLSGIMDLLRLTDEIGNQNAPAIYLQAAINDTPDIDLGLYAGGDIQIQISSLAVSTPHYIELTLDDSLFTLTLYTDGTYTTVLQQSTLEWVWDLRYFNYLLAPGFFSLGVSELQANAVVTDLQVRSITLT